MVEKVEISENLIQVGFRLNELSLLSIILRKVENDELAKVWSRNFRIIYDRETFKKDYFDRTGEKLG